MEADKQRTPVTGAPQDPSRRRFGANVAALALVGAALPVLGTEHPLAEPRTPIRPRPFAFKLGSPESVGMSGERLRRIHAMLQRKIDAGEISGAVTAVARRGQLVHYQAHGYANVLTKQPMPLDAIFRMASSTKPVTGVALMMMMEEGKVRTEDPVSRYIPEFRDTKVAMLRPGEPARRAPGAPPRKVDIVSADRPITVLDLATHTSGLLSSGAGADVLNPQRGADDTLATYIPKLGAVPLDFQPGTKWAYSGGAGIDTLGRIVEIVSGQDFESFTRERIFEPLGMVDTYFNVPAAKRARLLPQQRKVNGEWQVTPNATDAPATKYFAGAGGLQSTAKDYLLFEQMLVNGGELNGKRLLSSRTVEYMGTNQVGDLYGGVVGPNVRVPGLGFGITMEVVLDWAVAHSGLSDGGFGWSGAFGTRTWNDRAEEIAGVLMMQQRDVEHLYDYEMSVRQAIVD